MKIKILGCSGGIGASRRTTCLLLGEDTLVDCGTGAGELDLAAMKRIDRIFLTHSHLDHVALLPMLADSAGNFRDAPLTVHALPETIDILKSGLFNGLIWPDYTVLPSPGHPYVRFSEIAVGQSVPVEGGRVTALPARHSVPAVGYLFDSGSGAFAFSGDTTYCEAFWDALAAASGLEYLLIEATFLDSARERAKISGHMTPSLLAEGFRRLGGKAKRLISHLEAGMEDRSMAEILALAGEFSPMQAENGQVFEF